MRKIIIYTLLILFAAGCSALKKTTGNRKDRVSGRSSLSINELVKNNLSSSDFFIQKADIGFESGDGGFNAVATIKFVYPDEYLISLRMRSGIELVRIYINSDTLLANDRINRVLYFGEPEILSLKYHVPFEMFPAIFGDFIGQENIKVEELECFDGVSEVESYIKGQKLVYTIDCKTKKPIFLRQESYTGSSGEISYGKFDETGIKAYPLEVSITHKGSGNKINIKIEKIETPWEGEIDFIPGNRYKKKELK